MKQKFSLFIYLLLSTSLYSQINEVGVFLGGSNFIGDIGPTTYINPNEPAIGILYKWNKSPRHAFRIQYTASKLVSNDLDSNESSRNLRGYNFENNIKEVSLGLEFNFFDFNLHELGSKTTPYIYSGISYTRYKSLFFNSAGELRSSERRGTFGIPLTVGIKTRLSRAFILALETGARYTFADDIDGSVPNDPNLSNLSFGNINNNDWYVFSGVTLTYTFGEKPCYCNN